MSKTINLPGDLVSRLGPRYGKIASTVALFNNAKDHNERVRYLCALRGEAQLAADASIEMLKFAPITTDQKVDRVSDHRAAGLQVLALCDAAVI